MIEKDQEIFDVIIVGAGMAGLTAAHHMIVNSSGIHGRIPKVLVLEASEYIGGRIRAITWSDGLKLNIGAHWIAGYSPLNPINKLFDIANSASVAKDRCKITNFDPQDIPMISADGSLLPYDWNPLIRAFECFECLECIECLSESDNRYRLSIEAALASVGWSAETEQDRLALWFLCDFEWGFSSLETPVYHTVPAPYKTAFDSDDQCFIATDGGAPDILLPYVDVLELSNCLRLNEKVVSISEEEEQKGLLTVMSSKQKYLAHAVIVTASLNIIASNTIKFTPSLPEDKTNVLTKYAMKCMAQYEIVLVEFAFRFWDKYCILYTGPLSIDRRASRPMFIHDLSSYYECRPILEFHLTGEDAVRMASQSLEETHVEIMTIMRSIFKCNIPDPIRVYCTNWNSNPFTLGAFSVRPMGMTDDEHESLRRSCMGQKLIFAGDGLHKVHTGYMHGAFISGVDAASEALRVLDEKIE